MLAESIASDKGRNGVDACGDRWALVTKDKVQDGRTWTWIDLTGVEY